MLLFNWIEEWMLAPFSYFNTSNVTIQLLGYVFFAIIYQYFNTSNVTIQLDSLILKCHILAYFNTSNVTIQRRIKDCTDKRNAISIHLMLLFNRIPCFVLLRRWNFNTSNVTIQLWMLSAILFIVSNFNTSNVTIQPLPHFFNAVIYFISIHLMLLFNLTISSVLWHFLRFQYI